MDYYGMAAIAGCPVMVIETYQFTYTEWFFVPKYLQDCSCVI